jgi:hypothetical protein
MKEYSFEDGKKVDISKLQAGYMNQENYIAAHKSLVIPCHDVLIKINNGLLLVIRDNYPLKGELWPIGGRILRGVNIIDSLKLKVKAECNLEINNIVSLGSARTFLATDPFGHGKGTDTTVEMYFAISSGELKLDDLHKDPQIITKDKYEEIKDSLHPYVKDMMELAWTHF